MNINKISVGILLAITLTLFVNIGTSAVTTQDATDVGIYTVTLNGDYTGTGNEVYFRVGPLNTNLLYCVGSKHMNTTGNFSYDMEGLPLIPGINFYFSACDNESNETCGVVKSFNLSPNPPPHDYNFDKEYENLTTSKFNMTKLAEILPRTYTLHMGESIFWGLIFGMIFLGVWARHEDVAIPSLLGMMIGGSIWSLLPPEWKPLATGLLIVSLGGIMYTLIKGHQK